MVFKVIAFVLLSVTAFAQRTNWCSIEESLSVPSSIPLRISSFSFGSSDDISGGLVNVVNPDVRTVDSLLIVFEMLDEDGKHVINIPLYIAGLRQHSWPFRFEKSDWVLAHAATYGRLEGKGARLGYESPIIPPRCPKSARVVFAEIVYSDGTSLEVETDFPDDPPLLVRAGKMNLGKFNSDHAYTLRSTVTVNEKGEVTAVSIDSAAGSGAAELLQEKMKEWKFSQSRGEHQVSLVLVVSAKPDLPHARLADEDVARAVKASAAIHQRHSYLEIVGIRRDSEDDSWAVVWSTRNQIIVGANTEVLE